MFATKKQSTPHWQSSINVYDVIEQKLKQSDIHLVLTRKRVKNINFRLKPNRLLVSAPYYVSDSDIALALHRRLNWAITQHALLLKRSKQRSIDASHSGNNETLRLWGEPQPFEMDETQRIEWYRSELKAVMPTLFAKWQPIVGKRANETRIKKMKTRWGSCNTRAKRVWLSVHLPAYPIECTEYVIVHELCHLHHANHSAAFWAEVTRAMPEYKHWHNMLAGKVGVVD